MRFLVLATFLSLSACNDSKRTQAVSDQANRTVETSGGEGPDQTVDPFTAALSDSRAPYRIEITCLEENFRNRFEPTAIDFCIRDDAPPLNDNGSIFVSNMVDSFEILGGLVGRDEPAITESKLVFGFREDFQLAITTNRRTPVPYTILITTFVNGNEVSTNSIRNGESENIDNFILDATASNLRTRAEHLRSIQRSSGGAQSLDGLSDFEIVRRDNEQRQSSEVEQAVARTCADIEYDASQPSVFRNGPPTEDQIRFCQDWRAEQN